MKFTAHYSGSAGNLYSVTASEGGTLLIDPGITQSALRKVVDLYNVCGALVTHSHLDHSKTVPYLLQVGIPCYASPGTITALGLDSPFLYSVQAQEPFAAGRFNCYAFDVKHDAPGSYGFVVQNDTDKLLFVIDTPYISSCFKNVTIIAVECNFSDETMDKRMEAGWLKIRIRQNHMSLKDCQKFIEANQSKNLREIHLLHLSDNNSHAEMFKVAVQKQCGVPVYVA